MNVFAGNTKHKVGEELTIEEARAISNDFVEHALMDEIFWEPHTYKRGQLLLLNNASYGKPPIFIIVKVTSVKNDWEEPTVRVTDGAYSWRI